MENKEKKDSSASWWKLQKWLCTCLHLIDGWIDTLSPTNVCEG